MYEFDRSGNIKNATYNKREFKEFMLAFRKNYTAFNMKIQELRKRIFWVTFLKLTGNKKCAMHESPEFSVWKKLTNDSLFNITKIEMKKHCKKFYKFITKHWHRRLPKNILSNSYMAQKHKKTHVRSVSVQTHKPNSKYCYWPNLDQQRELLKEIWESDKRPYDASTFKHREHFV
jgi:hypothetical protein